jgi:hypothetical protein
MFQDLWGRAHKSLKDYMEMTKQEDAEDKLKGWPALVEDAIDTNEYRAREMQKTMKAKIMMERLEKVAIEANKLVVIRDERRKRRQKAIESVPVVQHIDKQVEQNELQIKKLQEANNLLLASRASHAQEIGEHFDKEEPYDDTEREKKQNELWDVYGHSRRDLMRLGVPPSAIQDFEEKYQHLLIQSSSTTTSMLNSIRRSPGAKSVR